MAKLIIGENDLETLHPELVEEWNQEKNKPIKPCEVTCGSNKKVWWKCKEGHEWQTTISERTRKDKPSGCPYCAHKRVISGENDFATLYPELLEEWDYEKNAPLIPEHFLSKSNQKVWWRCKRCGNEWQASIGTRTNGHGCSVCSNAIHTSFQEQAIFYYMKQAFPNTVNGYIPQWEKSKAEIDIYIPDINLGIEYDGQKWHQNTKKDKQKTEWVVRNGAQLIRIREPKCPALKDDSHQIIISETDNDYDYLENVIIEILKYISDNYEIDTVKKCNIKKDYPKILATYEKNKFNESLEHKYPEIAKEWDYEKNAPLKPQNITAHTYKKVWWTCRRCNNSYLQAVSNRVSGTECPYCAGKKIKKGFNDLMTLNPSLASEWHSVLNKNTNPSGITLHSRKSVWWKCGKCGYEWQAPVYSRSTGVGCPACTNKTVWKGHNDLATTNPELAKEWDYEKNGEMLPAKVTAGSHQKVWWKCRKCNYRWKTGVVNRCKGSGCPQCAKDKQSVKAQKQNLKPGENDFATLYPELLEEWDYERNGQLIPEELTAHSGKAVWWKCKECKNEWKAVINSRTGGTGCPICCRRKMTKIMHAKALAVGENDLATKHPELVEEWNYEKNEQIKPSEVTCGTTKKVWWKCRKCGYEWQARVSHRVNGSGCPVCKNLTVWTGYNDIVTTNPEIAEAWDFEKNGSLVPAEVSARSGRTVWWKCSICNHKWQKTVRQMVLYPTCPQCHKRLNAE